MLRALHLGRFQSHRTLGCPEKSLHPQKGGAERLRIPAPALFRSPSPLTLPAALYFERRGGERTFPAPLRILRVSTCRSDSKCDKFVLTAPGVPFPAPGTSSLPCAVAAARTPRAGGGRSRSEQSRLPFSGTSRQPGRRCPRSGGGVVPARHLAAAPLPNPRTARVISLPSVKGPVHTFSGGTRVWPKQLSWPCGGDPP